MDGAPWRIGQLAEATGVSVRSLRHYDAIGLLVPSERNGAGHRRYTGQDVRRLHQIVALRGFGLSLAEVAGALDGPDTALRRLLEVQLDQVAERLAVGRRLQERLERALATPGEPSVPQLVELIEVMTMDQRLTAAQLAELTERRREMFEQLTPGQREEMDERRRQFHEQLAPDQLEELNRRRAALLPE
jgi:MerR family transcriptional regulator, thiopeptide resistance regulator